ncbi:MAG: ribulose-phosphate 3-epimerase [Candidatus Thermoplasmatota archaeon]
MIKEKYIIPAIIAKNQNELVDKINKVKDYVDIIQLDVMDGNFVPNNSINFDFNLPETKCKFEGHLMIEKTKLWIEQNYQLVDTVLAHYESMIKPSEVIELTRSKGKKIGFVLNPETPVEKIRDFIDEIDQVLIMTVKPGFYGSQFIRETLEKVSKLREIKPDLEIEVDGGISGKTIELADEAGANRFVSGSYILKSDDVKKSIDTLKEKIKN